MHLPSAKFATIVAIGALAVASGCDQRDSSRGTAPTNPAAKTGAAAPHSHADGSTHAAHSPDPSPAPAGGHAHGGEIFDLGTRTAGAFSLAAKLEGDLVPGGESVFLIEVTPAAAAVRLWIGDEQATGTTKSKAEGGPTSFHAHVLVPGSLSETSQLWLEVQDAAGNRASAAVILPTSGAPAQVPKNTGGTHSHGGESHSH